MKKLIALLLAVVMVLGMVACDKTPSADDNPAQPDANPDQNDVSTEVNIDDLPTLNVLFVHGYSYENYETNVIWQEVAKKVGAKIHFIAADTDKMNSMLASGQGWDLVIAMGANMKSTAETGSVVALSDYKDKLPNVYANLSTNIEWSIENTGDGNLYFIGNNIAPDGTKVGSTDATRGQVRWDLYAELGYPEINSQEDFTQMLIDMVENNPTGPDGKPAYAHCIPSESGVMFNHLTYPFADWAGVNPYPNSTLAWYKWEDMSYVNLLDPDAGLYWSAIEHYRTLYKAGALDPDSFAIPEADMKAKANAGNLYSVFASWQYAAAELPEGAGFSSIPVTFGSTNVLDVNYGDNGENVPWGYGVNVDTEYLDECLAYLDFMASYEGANLIFNGIEGVHYTVDENGVRSLTDEAWALKEQGNEAWEKYGLFCAEINNLGIYIKTALMSDGQPLNLLDAPVNINRTLSATQKAFSDHYGVSYPAEKFIQVMNDNDLPMMSMVSLEEKNSVKGPTDDIKALENAVQLEAETWAATLIMASDAQYEKLCADAMEAFNAAGLTEINDYYNSL